MPGGHWEDEVYSVEPLRDLERTNASVAFEWLAERFPVDGGKIDWASVEGRHTHRRFDDERSLTAAAFAEITDRARPGSMIEHVGDGLSLCGVRFTATSAAAVAAALLEIPEHHYFLSDDRGWVVVVSFEGELDVVDGLQG